MFVRAVLAAQWANFDAAVYYSVYTYTLFVVGATL
jgi:hypothetical protein